MWRPRLTILATFLAGLLLQIGAVAVTVQHNTVSSADSLALITKLLAIYSVQFAIIVGGMFSQGRPASRRAFEPYAAALGLSALWNILLAWRTLSFAFNTSDTAADVITYLDTISGASSFLVAGALVYYFGKHD